MQLPDIFIYCDQTKQQVILFKEWNIHHHHHLSRQLLCNDEFLLVVVSSSHHSPFGPCQYLFCTGQSVF